MKTILSFVATIVIILVLVAFIYLLMWIGSTVPGGVLTVAACFVIFGTMWFVVHLIINEYW